MFLSVNAKDMLQLMLLMQKSSATEKNTLVMCKRQSFQIARCNGMPTKAQKYALQGSINT